jgi:hypothetical protein
MKDPKCKRFHRICDDFSLCVNMGEKGYVLAEHPNERFTIFYYGLYGSGIFGRVFDKEEPIILDANKNLVVDVQNYVHDKVLFEATEDFYIVGFNTLDKKIKWDAKILDSKTTEIRGDCDKSYALCMNGSPHINGKKFKRYDYSLLLEDEIYDVTIKNDDIIIIFSQVGEW